MKITLRQPLKRLLPFFPSATYGVTVCWLCGDFSRPVRPQDDPEGDQGSEGAEGAPVHCIVLGSLHDPDEVSSVWSTLPVVARLLEHGHVHSNQYGYSTAGTFGLRNAEVEVEVSLICKKYDERTNIGPRKSGGAVIR